MSEAVLSTVQHAEHEHTLAICYEVIAVSEAMALICAECVHDLLLPLDGRNHRPPLG